MLITRLPDASAAPRIHLLPSRSKIKCARELGQLKMIDGKPSITILTWTRRTKSSLQFTTSLGSMLFPLVCCGSGSQILQKSCAGRGSRQRSTTLDGSRLIGWPTPTSEEVLRNNFHRTRNRVNLSLDRLRHLRDTRTLSLLIRQPKLSIKSHSLWMNGSTWSPLARSN